MGRKERLPEHTNKIQAEGARLKVILEERRGTREMQIIGNRKGLRALAAICFGLAELTDDELLTPANHYHLDENFWGTEKGSIPLLVSCRESATKMQYFDRWAV